MRKECWGVYDVEQGWYTSDGKYELEPKRRCDFETLQAARENCRGEQYPRRFWRSTKPKTCWCAMTNPPADKRNVLIRSTDRDEAFVVYYDERCWRYYQDRTICKPASDDMWCELPSR